MSSGEFSTMILAILPEIGLVLLAGILLVLDLAWGVDKRRRNLGWVTAIGLALLVLLAVMFSRPSAEGQLIWGGMLRLDSAGFIFRLLFLSGAALTALFAAHSEGLAERGEFFALMLVSTLRMS